MQQQKGEDERDRDVFRMGRRRLAFLFGSLDGTRFPLPPKLREENGWQGMKG